MRERWQPLQNEGKRRRHIRNQTGKRFYFYTNNSKYNDLSKFEYLGNKPMTDFEKGIDFKLGDGRSGLNGGFPLAGLMASDYGKTAFLEWCWINEKDIAKLIGFFKCCKVKPRRYKIQPAS